MHATEWIAHHARFKRTLSLTSLRESLGRKTGECTWCGGKIKNGRRRWCSRECEKEGYLRCGQWQFEVEQRDKGVCAICGFDSLAAQNRVRRIMKVCKGGGASMKMRPYSFVRLRNFSRKTRIYSTGQPYEEPADAVLSLPSPRNCGSSRQASCFT